MVGVQGLAGVAPDERHASQGFHTLGCANSVPFRTTMSTWKNVWLKRSNSHTRTIGPSVVLSLAAYTSVSVPAQWPSCPGDQFHSIPPAAPVRSQAGGRPRSATVTGTVGSKTGTRLWHPNAAAGVGLP
jgi:hypothetical protein